MVWGADSQKEAIVDRKKEIRELQNHFRSGNNSGSHINCIRIGKNETYDHALAKFNQAWLLIQQNKDFLTEGIFISGDRCDVADTDKFIYELLHSETLDMFKQKSAKYPVDFLIYPIDSKELNKKVLEQNGY